MKSVVVFNKIDDEYFWSLKKKIGGFQFIQEESVKEDYLKRNIKTCIQ